MPLIMKIWPPQAKLQFLVVTITKNPAPRLVAVDTLSRAPTGPCEPLPHTFDLLSDVNVLVASVTTDAASPFFLARLQEATAADTILSNVSKCVLNEWPACERDVALHFRAFFSAYLSLSVAQVCLFTTRVDC